MHADIVLMGFKEDYNLSTSMRYQWKINKKFKSKIVMSKTLVLAFMLLLQKFLFSQFPGPVGTAGSTAIHKDSSIFVAWASACKVQRGYQDIANPNLGKASFGDSSLALGAAGSNGVVSLGDGGFAIVTFQNPIRNGEGFDFAIFENSFSDVFLELAFVEVSSDGINYFRFPATSNTQTTAQIGPFDNASDATKLNNLAGKYRALYGTPFDLQELSGVNGLDVNHITHIKIIDAVGSINPLFATYDINNNSINDPFPTAFASGGFDLDAVGVIHQQPTARIQKNNAVQFHIYPNPLLQNQKLTIQGNENIIEIEIKNAAGVIVKKLSPKELIHMEFKSGLYFLQITTVKGVAQSKLIVK